MVYSHKHSTKCTGYKHRTYNGQKVDSEWVINKIIIDNGEVVVDEVGKRGGWRCGWAGELRQVGLVMIETTFSRPTNRGLDMLPEKQAPTARFENFSIAGLNPPRVDDIPCFEGAA